MDKFKTVLNIVANKQTNLGLVALLTAGGEQIFSTAVFKCPCNDWNFFYGMVFLLVPALALLVLGYILSKKTWKLFTGLCVRKSKWSKWCRVKTVIGVLIMFLQVTTTAVVAPFSWIAVALLNGNYIECAFTGVNVSVYKDHLCGGLVDGWVTQAKCQQELYKFPCPGKSTVPGKDDVLATLRAESQIAGWLVIASIIVSNLILTCVARCKSPISYLQLKFWRAYAQEENALLESYSAKHAKELAERNLKSFFQQTPPAPLTSPSNQDWQKISRFYRFNPNDHYYSTMHQYVESDKREADNFHSRDHGMGSIILHSIQSDGPSPDNPAVLSFLDDAKMPL